MNSSTTTPKAAILSIVSTLLIANAASQRAFAAERAEAIGPERHAREQVAEHRADAQAEEQRRDHARRHQEQQRLLVEGKINRLVHVEFRIAQRSARPSVDRFNAMMPEPASRRQFGAVDFVGDHRAIFDLRGKQTPTGGPRAHKVHPLNMTASIRRAFMAKDAIRPMRFEADDEAALQCGRSAALLGRSASAFDFGEPPPPRSARIPPCISECYSQAHAAFSA